ncbi:MAG: thermonuclease family protein [Patescibacteria group bacterium]|nr:thermonuclease family protein [Patescibacteria group bacterium]
MQKRLFYFLGILLLLAFGDLAYGYSSGQFKISPVVGDTVTIVPQPMPSSETGGVVSSSLPAAVVKLETNASVTKVVDGDTLEVKIDEDDKARKIRMLGINTPETVDPRKTVECYGKEASAKMHELAEGKRVRLEADPQADEQDKYGRLLRNVFLDDGTDLNAHMVREGYAYAYLSFPLNPLRKQELKDLENDAKMAGRGLWNTAKCPNND